MSARSEPAAELEETSYRWRAGRMADLGYIDYYEALAVFRPSCPTSHDRSFPRFGSFIAASRSPGHAGSQRPLDAEYVELEWSA